VRIDLSDDGDQRPDPADAPGVHRADAARDSGPDRGVSAERPAPGQGDDASADRAARNLEHRATVERVERAHAIDQGYARVRETEEKTVTPAMRRIEAEDPDRTLVGLENRLKGKDRLAEKVAKAVNERGHSVDEAFGLVKDAIRYTFCYPKDRYTDGVYADCARLEQAGFERVERENSWTKEQYKGINSRWRVPDNGQLFEVQFHTAASFEAKEITHPAYEKLRIGVPTRAEQRELEDFQKRITAGVPIPPGGTKIPDYP
jgi:hypothetical protein